jgi:hypothetical protein
MKNTQLVELLKSFSAYEMNRFEKFVLSPFFNRNEKVISLLHELKKGYPAFEGPSLIKERVYKKVFPGKVYNDKKIRDVTHELLKLAEEFIGILDYQNRKQHFPELDILSGLGEKQQKSLFEKRAKSFENRANISSCTNAVYFYNKWISTNTKLRYRYFFYGRQPEASQLAEEGEALIMLTLVNLSYIFYNISTAGHAGNAHADSYIIDEFINSVNLESICSKAISAGHKYAEIIEIYYCMIMMITREDDESYFYRLKDIMSSVPKILVKEDIFNVYTNLTAYCVRKIMNGKTNFHREELDIYKDQLKNDAYYIREDNKSLSPVIYHNILLLCFYLKEYDWAEKFIEEYTDKLIPEERENMLYYSYACLSLEKKAWGKALEFISKIKAEQFYLKYEIRYLLLKAHYELKNYEAVFSMIDSSFHFLRKSKFVSAQRKENFGNFLQFLKELVRSKLDNDRSRAGKLRQKILKQDIISQKSWLIEKAGEI